MPREYILDRIALALNTTPEYLTDTDIPEHPDTAYAKCLDAVRRYGGCWKYTQKKELINELIDAI